MIVKIQAPLSDPGGPVLVYDQKRTLQKLMPPDKLPSVIRTALRAAPKVYWNVQVSAQPDPLIFAGPAPPQTW